MRNLCEMVAVTYGEFQSWYNYGELRVSADRLVCLEVNVDGVPDPESPHAFVLMERLPQLSLEDEEGVLIVQLSPLELVASGVRLTSVLDARTLYLSVTRVKRVIPLTERAKRILKPRLQSLGVSIDGALFHRQVRVAWFGMGVRRALRGGDALVAVLFSDGKEVIGNALRQAVEGGIWALDHKDDHSAVESPSAGFPWPTWVPDAFSFTRHKPYLKGNRDLHYVLDAGVVLKAMAERQQKEDGFLEPLRKACNIFGDTLDPALRLPEIFRDERFEKVAKQTKLGLPDAFPADLGTLAALLYWKDAFHKSKEEIDYALFRKELPEFVSALGFDETVAAVWLLGCFAGYERIAPAVYASDPEVFAWYSGAPLKLDKIGRPNPELPKESQTQVSEMGLRAEEQPGADAEMAPSAAETRPANLSKGLEGIGVFRESEGTAETVAADDIRIVEHESSASADSSEAAPQEREPAAEERDAAPVDPEAMGGSSKTQNRKSKSGNSGTSRQKRPRSSLRPQRPPNASSGHPGLTESGLEALRTQGSPAAGQNDDQGRQKRPDKMQQKDLFQAESPTVGGADKGEFKVADPSARNAAAASQETEQGEYTSGADQAPSAE